MFSIYPPAEPQFESEISPELGFGGTLEPPQNIRFLELENQ